MFISSERSPEQTAFDGELMDLLQQAVERLPDDYRSVLVMRDIEGLDTSETAECLSISEETVKTRLHRARGMPRNNIYTRVGTELNGIFAFHQARCDCVVAAVFDRIDRLAATTSR